MATPEEELQRILDKRKFTADGQPQVFPFGLAGAVGQGPGPFTDPAPRQIGDEVSAGVAGIGQMQNANTMRSDQQGQSLLRSGILGSKSSGTPAAPQAFPFGAPLVLGQASPEQTPWDDPRRRRAADVVGAVPGIMESIGLMGNAPGPVPFGPAVVGNPPAPRPGPPPAVPPGRGLPPTPDIAASASVAAPTGAISLAGLQAIARERGVPIPPGTEVAPSRPVEPTPTPRAYQVFNPQLGRMETRPIPPGMMLGDRESVHGARGLIEDNPANRSMAFNRSFQNDFVRQFGRLPTLTPMGTEHSIYGSNWTDAPTAMQIAAHQNETGLYNHLLGQAVQTHGNLMANELGRGRLGLETQTQFGGPGGQLSPAQTTANAAMLHAQSQAVENGARYSPQGMARTARIASLTRQRENDEITQQEFDRQMGIIANEHTAHVSSLRGSGTGGSSNPPGSIAGNNGIYVPSIGANGQTIMTFQPNTTGPGPTQTGPDGQPQTRWQTSLNNALRSFRTGANRAITMSGAAGTSERTNATNLVIRNYLSGIQPEELRANYNQIIGTLEQSPHIGNDAIQRFYATPMNSWDWQNNPEMQTHQQIIDRLAALHGHRTQLVGTGLGTILSGGLGGGRVPVGQLPLTLNNAPRPRTQQELNRLIQNPPGTNLLW